MLSGGGSSKFNLPKNRSKIAKNGPTLKILERNTFENVLKGT